jgi:hypothetical protein
LCFSHLDKGAQDFPTANHYRNICRDASEQLASYAVYEIAFHIIVQFICRAVGHWMSEQYDTTTEIGEDVAPLPPPSSSVLTEISSGLIFQEHGKQSMFTEACNEVIRYSSHHAKLVGSTANLRNLCETARLPLHSTSEGML